MATIVAALDRASFGASDREVILHVLNHSERDWVVATELAERVLDWQPASLRRKLSEISWEDKILVKVGDDSLRAAGKCGVLRGSEVRGLGIGRVRSLNLLAVDSLPALLRRLLGSGALLPRFTLVRSGSRA
jgi:hypothetical protein